MTDNQVIVSRQQLYEMVWAQPMSRGAEALGVPYSEFRNACKRLAVPCPSNGYWEKVRAGKIMARPELPDFVGPQQLPIYKVAAKTKAETKLFNVTLAPLGGQHHPLVREARRGLTIPKGKFSSLDRGRLRQDYRSKALTCTVSAEQLERALSIWDGILRSGEASGLSFSVESDGRTYVKAFGHRSWVRLFESVRSEPGEPWNRDVPTGRLRFYGNGPAGLESRFSDEPGNPLENQIEPIILKLLQRLHAGIAIQKEHDLWKIEYDRKEKLRLQEIAERNARAEAERRLKIALTESTRGTAGDSQ